MGFVVNLTQIVNNNSQNKTAQQGWTAHEG
jgi:hypothetical protein